MEGYQWLRERSPVAIAAGEGECGWYSYKPWVENQLLDIYQVDLARNGFTEAKRIADKVEEQGAKLCNHCYKTPISVAACLHWLSTTKTALLFEDCVYFLNFSTGTNLATNSGVDFAQPSECFSTADSRFVFYTNVSPVSEKYFRSSHNHHTLTVLNLIL